MGYWAELQEMKGIRAGMEKYRIRAHHGMCLAFFVGKGYSGKFTEHMGMVKQELEKNPRVCIVDETDEICRYCPNNVSGICTSGQPAGYDGKVLELCGLAAGEELEWKEFEDLVRSRILDTGRRKTVCGDCQWDFLCYNNILEDA